MSGSAKINYRIHAKPRIHLMQYEDFLGGVITNNNLKDIPPIYHQVRKIPYGSNGNRDPRVVYESNVGSCSGKHILLRDLLRHADYEAEIITMFTYFNESTPLCESFPSELKILATKERIPDFHHYVRVKQHGNWVKLDVTWHDELDSFGFAVNTKWAGEGDTLLASVPEQEYANEERLIDFKARLVATLPDDQKALRARYFELVTKWIADNALAS